MKPPLRADCWGRGDLTFQRPLTFQRSQPQCLGVRLSKLGIRTGVETACPLLPHPPLCPWFLCLRSECTTPALEASYMVKGRDGILKVTAVAQSSGFATPLAPHGRFALVQTPSCSDVSSCAHGYEAEQCVFSLHTFPCLFPVSVYEGSPRSAVACVCRTW